MVGVKLSAHTAYLVWGRLEHTALARRRASRRGRLLKFVHYKLITVVVRVEYRSDLVKRNLSKSSLATVVCTACVLLQKGVVCSGRISLPCGSGCNRPYQGCMVAPCKLQVGPTCWGRLHSFPRVISKEVGVVRRRKHRAGEKLIYGNDREPAGEDSAVGALTPGARRGGVGGIMYGKVRSQTRMMMPRGMPAASRVLSNSMARSGASWW